jgi:hypothetical protein
MQKKDKLDSDSMIRGVYGVMASTKITSIATSHVKYAWLFAYI